MNPTQTIAFLCILLGIGVLCLVITLSNERVRREILNAANVYRHHALADLALRYEQEARQVVCLNQADAVRALEQIILDTTATGHEFSSITLAPGTVTAIQALKRDGGQVIFTPSAAAYLTANPQLKRRVAGTHLIHGLVCGPLVIAELRAVVRFLGVQVQSRAEQWEAVVLQPDDYSILPKQGLRARLRLG